MHRSPSRSAGTLRGECRRRRCIEAREGRPAPGGVNKREQVSQLGREHGRHGAAHILRRRDRVALRVAFRPGHGRERVAVDHPLPECPPKHRPHRAGSVMPTGRTPVCLARQPFLDVHRPDRVCEAIPVHLGKPGQPPLDVGLGLRGDFAGVAAAQERLQVADDQLTHDGRRNVARRAGQLPEPAKGDRLALVQTREPDPLPTDPRIPAFSGNPTPRCGRSGHRFGTFGWAQPGVTVP